MNRLVKEKIKEKLKYIYEQDNADQIFEKLETVIEKYQGIGTIPGFVDENDAMIITYGDSLIKEGERPLVTLRNFLEKYVGDAVTSVHLLPMFPYTSDDGFSVVDYREINPQLGNWDDVYALSKKYKMMYDAVINHISKSSEWFRKYLAGDEKYADYFIECDPNADYSSVVRPRALPLLTKFDTVKGEKYIWTTFSDDQIDLNYACPDVLIEIIDLLLFYVQNGAKYIRLDAVGFIWKELGTPCIHHPKTHEIIKLIRLVLENVAGDVILITETNVPHEENISYFGNEDEAHMVYQFPLAPLVLFSYLTENTRKLSQWASGIDATEGKTTYFNFLASHDGIGLRPAEGILDEKEMQILLDATISRGGRISYKNNGHKPPTPYELNISYQDALTPLTDSDENRIKRFIGAQTILMSVVGVPGIYIHSLLGSRNYYKGVEESGINRRINREQLNYESLVKELGGDTGRAAIFREQLRRLRIRKGCSAFSPKASQKVLYPDERVFAVLRENKETSEQVLALINVSSSNVTLENKYFGTDLLSGKKAAEKINLEPFGCMWIKL